MRRRFSSRRRYLLLGIVSAAAVLVVLIGSSVLARMQLGTAAVEAEFAQAAGMKQGDTVDVSGIEVGTVQSARIEGDHVVATLRIDHDLALGPDARAAIKMSTILGKIHIDLEPGDGSGLPDGRIRLANTSVPYNLGKVVNDEKYTTQFEHLERIDPHKLRGALDAMSQQIGDSPQLTVQAIDSVGALARVIDERRDEVDSLLKNLDLVSQAVSDNRNNVLMLLTQGQAVTEAAGQRQELIRALLDNVASLSKQLQDMGLDNNGQLGPLINNLNTMSEGLEKNRGNLDRLFEIMPVAVRQFNNVFGNGPYGDVYTPWFFFPDNWLCVAQAIQGCK